MGWLNNTYNPKDSKYYLVNIQSSMKTLSQQQELLSLKLKSYEEEIKHRLVLFTPQNFIDWFCKEGLLRSIQGVPRQSQLQTVLKVLSVHPEKTAQLFIKEAVVSDLLDQSKEIFDIAFIMEQHLKAKGLQQLENMVCLNKAEKRLMDILQKSSDPDSLLYIQNLKLYITLCQSSVKHSPPNSFSSLLFQQQRLQSVKIYQYLLKPLFEKKNLKPLYPKLTGLVSWLVMNTNRLDLAYDLSKKINSFILYHKTEKSTEMKEVTIAIFDLLSVKFPRDSGLSHQNLGALLVKISTELGSLFDIWLEARLHFIDILDYEQILRTLANLGATSLVLDVLTTLWVFMKRNRNYNILLRIFSGYIRQDYLKLTLRSSDDIKQYFRIILVFMIGFSNRERFEGEEIDELTSKICQVAHARRLSISPAYEPIIKVYSVYENRFSCLSELSKRFLNQIQLLSSFKLEIANIHALYNELVIRELQLEDTNGEWQSQRKASNRYRGLQNLGNTCYINAFLQALYMTKKFRVMIQSISQEEIPSGKQTTIYALQFLFEELTRKQFEQQEPLRPDYFRSELPEPYRSTPAQQDSGQFGRVYLQHLYKQLKGSNNQKLQKLLVQKLIKTIRCLKCNNFKTKEDNAFDIIMNVERGDTSIFLSRLILGYFKPETFRGQDKIFCEHCNMRNDSISELRPHKLSDILVLTISLFQYVGEGKKILLPLTFQFVLNVGAILQNPDLGEYELYAFIVHLGSLPSSGHYVCYSRNLEQNPMIWYCFDDGYVTECEIGKPEEFNFGENESPYMLFYSKKSAPMTRSVVKH